jgi:hypothetical protein
MAAYFDITQSGWALIQGPFDMTEVASFLAQKATRSQGLALPGTTDGRTGYYVDSKGAVSYYDVREGKWTKIPHAHKGAASDPFAHMSAAKQMKSAVMMVKSLRDTLGSFREVSMEECATDNGSLTAIMGTAQGSTGWYKDASTGMVAYFAVIGSEWIIEHGPFNAEDVNNLCTEAQKSPGLVALPGTLPGESGWYMDEAGSIKRFVVRNGQWCEIHRQDGNRKGELSAILGSLQGKSGWYRDTSGEPFMVAFFAVIGDEWTLVHGPFEELDLMALVDRAKQMSSSRGVPLPGTAERGSGAYIDGNGKVKRFIISGDEWIEVQQNFNGKSSAIQRWKNSVRALKILRSIGRLSKASDTHASHVVERMTLQKIKEEAKILEKKRVLALKAEQEAYETKIKDIEMYIDEELSIKEGRMKQKFDEEMPSNLPINLLIITRDQALLHEVRAEYKHKKEKRLAEQRELYQNEIQHINEAITREAEANLTKATRKQIILFKELQDLKAMHEKERNELEKEMDQIQARLQERLDKKKKNMERVTRYESES